MLIIIITRRSLLIVVLGVLVVGVVAVLTLSRAVAIVVMALASLWRWCSHGAGDN
jgi:ABC-type nickel/cobalt efflux system permease component RcnA